MTLLAWSRENALQTIIINVVRGTKIKSFVIEKVHERSITENEKSIAGVNRNYFE